MSAYRPIPEEDYMERKRTGATNIGWAEGVGYYVEDRQALEEFWKASDEIKKQRAAPLKGTFTCPICGEDTPHHHTQEEIEAAQPTIAGVIADCRYHLKLLRTGDCTDATKNAVASIYERIIDRLAALAPEQER